MANCSGAEVIPKFVLLLDRGIKLPLNGTEKHSRRYIYISDAVAAFDAILHKGQSNGIYNLGSDDEITNRELCALLVKCVRPAGDDVGALDAWIEPGAPKPTKDRGAMMNCSRLKALGWRPLVGIEEGIRRTVEWYTEHGETWWGDVEQIILPRH